MWGVKLALISINPFECSACGGVKPLDCAVEIVPRFYKLSRVKIEFERINVGEKGFKLFVLKDS